MSSDLSKGIEAIEQGRAQDEKKNLEEALDLYNKGLELLSSAMRAEKNKETKNLILEKIKAYLQRAEEIKKELGSKGSSGKKSTGDSKDESAEKEEDPEVAKLKGALAGAIVTETPNVKWEDVAGLETAKSLLKEAVLLPLKFPHLFVGKRTPWKGILLYGPPGTGKSFLAKAVATEAVSKYLGESERLVRNLFELARAKSPAIVFIDEIDSLCGNRSDGENDSARRIKTEFLVQMQGVGKSNEGILVLGATNTPWDLDPAIRRRFEKRIYIPLPDKEARAAMFRIHVGDTPNDMDDDAHNWLAENSEGLSGSDISNLVQDALMEPVRFLPEATHFKKVPNPDNPRDYLWQACSPGDPGAERHDLMELENGKLSCPLVALRDFVRVVATAKPSVSKADLKRQEAWTEEFGQKG